MLRKLVEPAWGPRKAAEIQPDDVDRLLRQIAGGTPGKRGRKPTPVRANRLGEILRKMFNLSVRWRIRADNPAARTTSARIERDQCRHDAAQGSYQRPSGLTSMSPVAQSD